MFDAEKKARDALAAAETLPGESWARGEMLKLAERHGRRNAALHRAKVERLERNLAEARGDLAAAESWLAEQVESAAGSPSEPSSVDKSG